MRILQVKHRRKETVEIMGQHGSSGKVLTLSSMHVLDTLFKERPKARLQQHQAYNEWTKAPVHQSTVLTLNGQRIIRQSKQIFAAII
ncbi:hypothetical protein MnTg02_02478 [bacterium MnTg02]|nr:hypothetical protein MnTg02_02478 [bacterium MnTg02]